MSVFAAVGPVGVLTLVLWAFVTVSIMGWAAFGVWMAPAERFRHGRWSKFGWMVAIVTVGWHLGALLVPVGAILARSRLWSPEPPPPVIPQAEGSFRVED